MVPKLKIPQVTASSVRPTPGGVGLTDGLKRFLVDHFGEKETLTKKDVQSVRNVDVVKEYFGRKGSERGSIEGIQRFWKKKWGQTKYVMNPEFKKFFNDNKEKYGKLRSIDLEFTEDKESGEHFIKGCLQHSFSSKTLYRTY